MNACGIEDNPLRNLYLDLLKRCLTGMLFEDQPLLNFNQFDKERGCFSEAFFDSDARQRGRDWPSSAITMIGMERMNNLQACVEKVIHERVEGDLIETGVWRGGAAIFMRALLAAFGDMSRTVWVADSFEGPPPPNPALCPADEGVDLTVYNDVLAVPLGEVKKNFDRYGFLDNRVKFLPGWFKNTLPFAPIDALSVLRLDGDLYASTRDALDHLYPKVSRGGYVIVDDYNIPACAQAVNEFRHELNISEKLIDIDGWGVFWRKDCNSSTQRKG